MRNAQSGGSGCLVPDPSRTLQKRQYLGRQLSGFLGVGTDRPEFDDHNRRSGPTGAAQCHLGTQSAQQLIGSRTKLTIYGAGQSQDRRHMISNVPRGCNSIRWVYLQQMFLPKDGKNPSN